MKFDRAHPAFKVAMDSARDVRADLSESTRFGAMRTFGEKLSEAVGDFGGRPRTRGESNAETFEQYLLALLQVGLFSADEYADLNAVREVGNFGAHGDEIYDSSRKRALAAFDRLILQVESVDQTRAPRSQHPPPLPHQTTSSYTFQRSFEKHDQIGKATPDPWIKQNWAVGVLNILLILLASQGLGYAMVKLAQNMSESVGQQDTFADVISGIFIYIVAGIIGIAGMILLLPTLFVAHVFGFEVR